MAREKKIIDASVIVKWFQSEPDSEKALQLRTMHLKENTLLIIPDLALIEVINVLRYKKWAAEEMIPAIRSLWDLQLHIERVNAFLLERAMHLAIQYNISIYDALYVAVANNFGVPLITADKALRKVPNVILLNSL